MDSDGLRVYTGGVAIEAMEQGEELVGLLSVSVSLVRSGEGWWTVNVTDEWGRRERFACSTGSASA